MVQAQPVGSKAQSAVSQDPKFTHVSGSQPKCCSQDKPAGYQAQFNKTQAQTITSPEAQPVVSQAQPVSCQNQTADSQACLNLLAGSYLSSTCSQAHSFWIINILKNEINIKLI